MNQKLFLLSGLCFPLRALREPSTLLVRAEEAETAEGLFV